MQPHPSLRKKNRKENDIMEGKKFQQVPVERNTGRGNGPFAIFWFEGWSSRATNRWEPSTGGPQPARVPQIERHRTPSIEDGKPSNSKGEKSSLGGPQEKNTQAVRGEKGSKTIRLGKCRGFKRPWNW